MLELRQAARRGEYSSPYTYPDREVLACQLQ